MYMYATVYYVHTCHNTCMYMQYTYILYMYMYIYMYMCRPPRGLVGAPAEGPWGGRRPPRGHRRRCRGAPKGMGGGRALRGGKPQKTIQSPEDCTKPQAY